MPSSSVHSGYYAPQDGKTFSTEQPTYLQHTGPERTPSYVDRRRSLVQKLKSSATPTEFKKGTNRSSRFARQDIYLSVFGKAMKTSHEENTSENYAFQEIGQRSSGRKSTFPLESVLTKIGGGFHTKGNKAIDGAEQRLFAPDDPDVIATYENNVSDTGATQNLGMDVSVILPAHKIPKKWRRIRE